MHIGEKGRHTGKGWIIRGQAHLHKWQEGNGVMVMGVTVMLLALFICLMFAQVFSSRMEGQDVQSMVDAVADGTAVYAMSSGARYDDAVDKAEEILDTYTDVLGGGFSELSLSIDKEAFESDNMVDVTLTASRPYLFLTPSITKTTSYSISKEAASTFTRNASMNLEGVPEEAIPTGDTLGEQVARFALQFVGNPYVWGGESLTNGADCSGFVKSVYANFGVPIVHSSYLQRNVGTEVPKSYENLWPGDIVCYSGHVSIYTGNGYMVHAQSTRTGIVVTAGALEYHPVITVRRVFDVSETSTE